MQEGLCRPEKLTADNYACHQANLFRQAYTGQLHAAPGLFSLQVGRPLQAGLCRPKAPECIMNFRQQARTVEPASRQTFAGRPVQAKSTRMHYEFETARKLKL